MFISKWLNMHKIKVINMILLDTKQSINFFIRIHEFDTQRFINNPYFKTDLCTY